MAQEKNKVQIAVAIEVRPDDPSLMNHLTCKTLRYEFSVDMKQEPLEFIVLHGRQEVFRQAVPD